MNPEEIGPEQIKLGNIPAAFIRQMADDDGSCVCVDEGLLVVLSLPDISEVELAALQTPGILRYSRNEESGVPTPLMTLAIDGLMTIDIPFYLFSDTLHKPQMEILLIDSAKPKLAGHRQTTFSTALLEQIRSDMEIIRHDPGYLDRVYDVFDRYSTEMLIEKAMFTEVLL